MNQLDTVSGEQEGYCTVADLLAKLLQHESLKIRLIIDNKNGCGHAA
jgi:hypothetical protein